MKPSTPTEHAGIIAFHIAQGTNLTNQDVQRLTDMTRSGAYKLMLRLSRVLPIYFDDRSNTWKMPPYARN